ncbi:MAG: SLC13 family permease [Deltaproteobacteria bacterium]|jgi:di/tricarboxylate transporter|nr:SLC13 family permease [Deltaproteobacteria bacterium]MBW2531310.1 SLC13 family permease [Deltaproteobacteria bacterium]
MTLQMGLALAVLAVTVVLFVSEWLRVDVVALVVMVALAWLGLVSPREALSGLASNAVVSIIGVMILGHGIDRTGVMNRAVRPLLRVAGDSKRRLLGLVSMAVGLISAFMQNIGAAALFLPAVLRIAKRMRFSPSRMLMPMGFAAILGGTLTMVASGPLIILNDLLRQGGHQPYSLFAVTPIGLVLLVAGVVYFLVLGPLVLPRADQRESESASPAGERDDAAEQRALIETWGLPETVFRLQVPDDSTLIGKTIDEVDLWHGYCCNLLALQEGDEVHHAPWRYTRFAAGQELALLGRGQDVQRFAADNALDVCAAPGQLLEQLQRGELGGFAEAIVRPRAPVTGQTLRQIALRKQFGIEPLLRLPGAGDQQQHDFSDQPLRPGDTLVVYGTWDRIGALGRDRSFVLATPVASQSRSARNKGWLASLCFLAAIALAIAGFPLSICLLSGAVAMVLFRVMTIDDAYRAVDWRTVFLLAGLIPLGVAMDNTGTAAWVAGGITALLAGSHPLVLLVAVALLATVFSLFMSNVAATVLLVPLVMLMAESTQVPAPALGLLVAVCASNSFVLPTHQVNALLMAPGGYRNADYLRAGGLMTVLFIALAVAMIYVAYL